MTPAITGLIGREIRKASRSGGSWAQGSVFFILFTVLAAFALGPEQEFRANLAPALVWLAASLASQLSLDRLFAEDLHDGTLECWFVDGQSLVEFSIGKFISHWLVVFTPILILSPLAALMLGAPVSVLALTFISLAIGGPALVFMGGMVSALTANLRGSGLLIVLISGPLLAAPLIFGVGAVQIADIASSELKILGAISLGAMVIAPVIATLALKVHLE